MKTLARQSASQSIYDGSAWPKVWGPEKLEATINEAYQKLVVRGAWSEVRGQRCVARGALQEVDCQKWIFRSELSEVSCQRC